MDNVDMLDIAELENERDNLGSKVDQVKFQQTGLTTEQKNLIETIFEEKTQVFTSSLKQQFNNMHLELIRNFM